MNASASVIPSDVPQVQRRQWRVKGRVQGIGFRPFIYRLACAHHLAGWVRNDSEGVLIEAQGTPQDLCAFITDVRTRKPAVATITAIAASTLPVAADEHGFVVAASRRVGANRTETEIAPDLAVCGACLAELRDPTDARRCGYPLVNCTDCGPRFSIIRGVPYDRPNTTMATFKMCAACATEYRDPADRRFHAQPIACRDCGPALSLLDRNGNQSVDDPVQDAARRLLAGEIVAVKGVGGFHFAVRADDERAVRRLRAAKRRPVKPLALMVPDVASAKALVALSDQGVIALTSTAAPIVLAPRQKHAAIAPSVAPGTHRFGVMLAYTPLHHLLFDALGHRCAALVLTSANDSDEPLVFDDQEARASLPPCCDAMLTHARPIERPVDDSVVIDSRGQGPIVLRRSRGYVPTPIRLPDDCTSDGVCVGGELKSVVGVVRGGQVILSQHLGDLENARTYANFKRAVSDLIELFGVRPKWIAHDLHPGYMSTTFGRHLAATLHVPHFGIQHHHAHAAAVLAEHRTSGPALAVVCDGTGFGGDGETIWGGELLRADLNDFKRLAHLQNIRLAGGDASATQPWRCGMSLLRAALGDAALDHPLAVELASNVEQARFVAQMLRSGANCVKSSSAGRVFDGVSALLRLCDVNSYESQAATALEDAAARFQGHLKPPDHAMFELRGAGCFTIDLIPLIREIVRGVGRGEPVEMLAARFHEQFAAAWEAAVVRASEATGLICVVLSGGVFCNEILDRELTGRLRARGLHVLRHNLVPPNDGGLALGQAAVAAVRARQMHEQPNAGAGGVACA